MKLFMDVHVIDGGVSVADVVDAHAKDLEVQDRHDVRYHRCWINEEAGRIFCLAEAPNADAAVEVHREAHGLLADEVWEVVERS